MSSKYIGRKSVFSNEASKKYLPFERHISFVFHSNNWISYYRRNAPTINQPENRRCRSRAIDATSKRIKTVYRAYSNFVHSKQKWGFYPNGKRFSALQRRDIFVAFKTDFALSPKPFDAERSPDDCIMFEATAKLKTRHNYPFIIFTYSCISHNRTLLLKR